MIPSLQLDLQKSAPASVVDRIIRESDLKEGSPFPRGLCIGRDAARDKVANVASYINLVASLGLISRLTDYSETIKGGSDEVCTGFGHDGELPDLANTESA